MTTYDVVIIGGGIAGLSAALSITRNADLTLLLLEKHTIGSTKASPFTFPDVVERFELSDAVFQKYTRFIYKSPTGVTASFEYEDPAFVTLDYHKACNIMLNRIRKQGNVDVLERTEALEMELVESSSSTTWKLILSNSADVSGNVVVDASGTKFFAAARLGFELPQLYSHAYGELLAGCRINDPKEMFIFAGNRYGNGGGWLYSIDKNVARFGFAQVTRSRVYPKALVEKNFKKAMRHFYPYSEMLRDASKKRSEFGTIPIGCLKKLVHERILIVGDAAGQATPWYNEGVRPALESGELCGKVIAEAYEKGAFHEPTLNKYQNLWDTKNRKSYSRGTQGRFESYSRSQKRWDASVKYQASLRPEEVIEIIRYNKWPKLQSKLHSRIWQPLRNLIRRTPKNFHKS